VLLAAFCALPANAGLASTNLTRVIVVLDDSVSSPRAVAHQQLDAVGGHLGFVYQHALKGYSASLPKMAIAGLLGDHRVRSVELDKIVQLETTQPSPPSYGLDRIDQRNLPLSNSYTYTANGTGVKAYDIDTGINTSHVDFASRIAAGVDLIDGGTPEDCNGHGTHTAGTIGSATYGVAKAVTIVPVRVFACGNTGTTSTIIAGVDWVTGDHLAGQPAVANMSLGGGADATMDAAVQRLINDGVTVAIAAGNGNILGNPVSACGQSPARVAAGITVGATDSADRRASFSNTGTCVDLHAPGVSIVSTWIGSPTATNSISGTSMAAPHVAGVAAQFLQLNPSATPAQVHSAIVNNATNNKVVIGCGLFGCPGGATTTRLLFTSY
jgi:subtilisin family serine protease